MDKFNQIHGITTQLWATIVNLESQISATSDFVQAEWLNPFTTPDWMRYCPDALPKLLRKQIEARDAALSRIESEIKKVEPVLKALTALAKDASAKVASQNPSAEEKYFNPVSITPEEALLWIESSLSGMEREYLVQQELIKSFVKGTASEKVKVRWESMDHVDSRIENEMRDRVKCHQKLFTKINAMY